MSGATPMLDRPVLPIPEDVRVGPHWSSQMVELADHIGPYQTLLLIEAFGGQRARVPIDPERNPFRAVLSEEAARTISHVYAAELFWVPTGRAALAAARRAPVIASVRAGTMTGEEATRLLGTSRRYLGQLVNQTDEGVGAKPLPGRRRQSDPRQIDMFPE